MVSCASKDIIVYVEPIFIDIQVMEAYDLLSEHVTSQNSMSNDLPTVHTYAGYRDTFSHELTPLLLFGILWTKLKS